MSEKIIVAVTNNDCDACSDKNLMQNIRDQIEEGIGVVVISTVAQLMAVRVMHRREEVVIQHIHWEEKDMYLDITHGGKLLSRPKGFLNETDGFLDVLCGLAD